VVDLAIRYCKPETVLEGAVRLFGEEMIPVCSPTLLRDNRRPLKRPQDLAQGDALCGGRIMLGGAPDLRRSPQPKPSACASALPRERFRSLVQSLPKWCDAANHATG